MISIFLIMSIPIMGLLIPLILIKQSYISKKKKVASFFVLPGLEVFLLISLFIKEGTIPRNVIISLAITIIVLNAMIASIYLKNKQ